MDKDTIMTTQTKIQKRNNRIRNLRFHHKWTLHEIGQEVHLTRERVRQICNKKENKHLIEEDIKQYYKSKFGKATLQDLMDDIKELRKPNRSKEVVLRRKYLIKFLYDELEVPFFRIGNLINRDHTSVMNLYYSEE